MENFEKNTIYYGDCFEIMQSFPDSSIDLILCDLPYGVTGQKWDNQINLKNLWDIYFRIIKFNCAVVLFSQQPFTTDLINSNRKNFKYDWVWDKHIPRNFQVAKYRPMSQHEHILVFGKGKTPYYPIKTPREKHVKVRNYLPKNNDRSMVKGNDINKHFVYTEINPTTIIRGCWEANSGKIHPTQKPVSLCEYLIKTYSKENDLVLDNCCGSGSTLLAAYNCNRDFIGIEIDQDFYEKAVNRLNLHKVAYGKQRQNF